MHPFSLKIGTNKSIAKMASTQALSPSLFHCNKSRYNRDESAGEIKLHVRNIRRGWARDQAREARGRLVLRPAEALAPRKNRSHLARSQRRAGASASSLDSVLLSLHTCIKCLLLNATASLS